MRSTKGTISKEVLERLVRLTSNSVCKYRVGAVVLDRKGCALAFATNRPRLAKLGGGIHAELAALRKVRGAHRVLLVRLGRGGELRPIHPCIHCTRILDKLGVEGEGIFEA